MSTWKPMPRSERCITTESGASEDDMREIIEAYQGIAPIEFVPAGYHRDRDSTTMTAHEKEEANR